MKRILGSLVFTLIGTVCLAGSPHRDKLTVMLDTEPKPDHAPLLIASQLGYFKEQNLDVKLIGPTGPAASAKAVVNGKADIGMLDQPDFIRQVDHNEPLIRVGTLIDKPLDSLVALHSSNIHDIKDLKGKRIGSSATGINSIMLKAMLRHHGLSDKDVTIVHINSSLMQALLTHKIDAANSIMRNYDIPQLEANNHKPSTFLPEENGIPNYSVMIFVAHLKKTNDPRFPRFLIAIKKAVAWLDEHPKEGWKIFANKYPQSNNAVNHEAWFATMPYFAEEPAEFDAKDWRKFADFMYDNKMIQKVQPTSRYAVVLN